MGTFFSTCKHNVCLPIRTGGLPRARGQLITQPLLERIMSQNVTSSVNPTSRREQHGFLPTTTLFPMKLKDCNFKVGELYIFSPSEHWAKNDPLLWGIFDKQTTDGNIMLEASTRDFINFTLWKPLPQEYTCCRLATRSELRDFIFNISVWQAQ